MSPAEGLLVPPRGLPAKPTAKSSPESGARQVLGEGQSTGPRAAPLLPRPSQRGESEGPRPPRGGHGGLRPECHARSWDKGGH